MRGAGLLPALDNTKTVTGTEGYIPPEQVYLKQAYLHDVYSLGITLYRMLVGGSPRSRILQGRHFVQGKREAWKMEQAPSRSRCICRTYPTHRESQKSLVT